MPKSERDHFVKSVKNPKLDYNDHKIKNEKYLNRKLTFKYSVEWMRWNGVYLYAYGCSLSGIACAILSPLLNLYGTLFLSSTDIKAEICIHISRRLFGVE